MWPLSSGVEAVEKVHTSRRFEFESETDLAGRALSSATAHGRGERTPVFPTPWRLATFSTASLGNRMKRSRNFGHVLTMRVNQRLGRSLQVAHAPWWSLDAHAMLLLLRSVITREHIHTNRSNLGRDHWANSSRDVSPTLRQQRIGIVRHLAGEGVELHPAMFRHRLPGKIVILLRIINEISPARLPNNSLKRTDQSLRD
jgi:hypothetical protein